jgi:positive regulator of sigma E activity
MHPIIIYFCVILTQLALAVFKVLEIKWVVENDITKSVVLFNIQTMFWIASTAWSVDSFLKGDWITIILFLLSGSIGKLIILKYFKRKEECVE